MKNCPVLLLLAACALVAASAPTFAQTGIPALDNAIKKLERLAPSAPAQGPAAEAPTKQPTQQAPEQPTATAPESRAKRDLDLVGVRLGMTLAEAQAALKNRNPNYEIEVLNVEFPAPGAMKFISGLHAQHNRKLVGGGSIPLGGGACMSSQVQSCQGRPCKSSCRGRRRHRQSLASHDMRRFKARNQTPISSWRLSRRSSERRMSRINTVPPSIGFPTCPNRCRLATQLAAAQR